MKKPDTILEKLDEKSKDMLTHFSSDGEGDEYNNYLSGADCYQELRTFISSSLTELLQSLIVELEGEKKAHLDTSDSSKWGYQYALHEALNTKTYNSALNLAQERIRAKLK